MAWQDDSVPDGIGDDPPWNGVTESQQGEPRLITDKWSSLHFFFGIFFAYIN